MQEGLLAEAARLMIESGMEMDSAIRMIRKEVLTQALIRTSGNQCSAALLLGMHRNTLSRQLIDLSMPRDARYWRDLSAKTKAAARRSQNAGGNCHAGRGDVYLPVEALSARLSRDRKTAV